MITIGPGLAQDIVRRTMQVIPFNVNVMDARGLILGSGDAERIGERHAGALLALSQGRAVEVDAVSAQQLQGAKPGVNLPLSVRGEICGVVGLTGAPEAVRQFGELVRITAEMILEQAQLIRELQRDTRYREEFVLQLIEPGAASTADLAAWAGRLGVDFQNPCSIVVLDLADGRLSPERAVLEQQNLVRRLQEHDPRVFTAAPSPRRMVLLESFPLTGEGGSLAELARRRLDALKAVVKEGTDTGVLMAIGVALTGIEGAALSYQSAKTALRIGHQRQPDQAAFSYYDLSLPVLLAGLGAGWQSEQLRMLLRSLQAGDKSNAILCRTLEAWFLHDGHAAATAKALHIHRNTLDYRLGRVEALTGLDLSRTDDRLLLYAALQLE